MAKNWSMGKTFIADFELFISQSLSEPFKVHLECNGNYFLLGEFNTESQARIYFKKLIKLQKKLRYPYEN
jgi:hypothetical protein